MKKNYNGNKIYLFVCVQSLDIVSYNGFSEVNLINFKQTNKISHNTKFQIDKNITNNLLDPNNYQKKDKKN